MGSQAKQTPVWFITAASSGFGKQIALEALSRGHKVIATARKSSSLSLLASKGAAVMDLDVTADQSVLDAKLKEAASIHGKLTHVVAAAGYIFVGAVEEASQQEVRDVYGTNVFGVLSVARAAAPYLREAAKEEGRIAALVTFGSLGSYSSGPAIAHYCSTKAAVSVLSEGLAGELKPFGIDVCCVEPGYTRTEFLQKVDGKERRIIAQKEMDIYKEGPAAQLKGAMDAVNGKQPGDVEKAARVIVDVLLKEGVAKGREIPVRLPLGSDCVRQIKTRIEEYRQRVEEWEETAGLVDYTTEY